MRISPIVSLSSLLVSDMRFGAQTKVLMDQLAEDIPDIVFYKLTQNERKVFWINIYNANFINFTKEYGEKARFKVREKSIIIGRQSLSLKDIENKILCGYRSKLFKGKYRRPFISDHIKKVAVEEYDPRVHFALVRGVKKGPKIICYHLGTIEQQLTYSARMFLEANIELDEINEKAVIPKQFKQYRNAIGNKIKMCDIIFDWTHIELDDYKISYKDFESESDVIHYDDDYELANFNRHNSY